MLKFSNALENSYTYYESSLLQNDNRKKCIYFKYCFNDKILKKYVV